MEFLTSSFTNQDPKTGTRKKLPIIRGQSCKDSTGAHEAPGYNERPVVPSDSDEDDDVPIAQRRRRLFQDDLNPNGEHVNEKDSALAPLQKDPITPSLALVEVNDYDFDRQVLEITICLGCHFFISHLYCNLNPPTTRVILL